MVRYRENNIKEMIYNHDEKKAEDPAISIQKSTGK